MNQFLSSILLVTLGLVGLVDLRAEAQENAKETNEVTAPEATPPSAQMSSPDSPLAPREASMIRFAGLVQYVNGSADRIDSRKARTPLSFQTSMYENERFQVAKDSSLKIVTRSGCIAVFYGDSQILTPNGEKPWRVKSEALRWICPQGSAEKLDFRGVEIRIDAATGGEFLLNGSRILVLRGTISAEGHEGPLPIGHLAQYQAKKWELVEPEPHPYNVWQFNEDKRPPKESAEFEKPDRPITTRWILTPIANSGRVDYDQEALKQDGLDGGGVRLQVHRQYGRGSLIFGISFADLRDKSKQSSSNTPPPSGAYSEIESWTLDAGYRFSHERWWSPYFRAGLSYDKSKVQVNRPDIGYYSRNEYEFYSLTGAFGIDAMYRPLWLNWFGLYAAGELQLTQSLGRGARRTLDNNSWYTGAPPAEASEPSRLTLISARIMLGAMLQF